MHRDLYAPIRSISEQFGSTYSASLPCVSVFPCLCVSVSMCPCVPVSHFSISLFLPFCLSLCLRSSVPLRFVSLSLSASICISVSVCPTHSISVYWSISELLGATYGDIVPLNTTERAFFSSIHVIAGIIEVYLTGAVLAVLTSAADDKVRCEPVTVCLCARASDRTFMPALAYVHACMCV